MFTVATELKVLAAALFEVDARPSHGVGVRR